MLEALMSRLGWGKPDLSKRFEKLRVAVPTVSGSLSYASEIETGERWLLKKVDSEKTAKYRSRFRAAEYASEIEIHLRIKERLEADGLFNDLPVVESGVCKSGQEYVLFKPPLGELLSKVLDANDDVLAVLQQRSVPLVRELAKSIFAIHDMGFMHRSIGPATIFCNSDLSVLSLLDFSTATPADAQFRVPHAKITQPIYTAPEITRRRSCDVTADVFSFGVLAYQLVSGKHPWGSTENSTQESLQFNNRPPVDIRAVRQDAPDLLADSIMKCLAVDPQKRHPSTKHFLIAAGLR